MGLEDFMNDREADEELHKRSGPEKKKVTEEMHRQYIQDRLFDSHQEFEKSKPVTLELKYEKALSQMRQLSVVYVGIDISALCARQEHKNQSGDLGIFVSGLVNSLPDSAEPIKLDLKKAPLLNYFGYKFRKKVVVDGNLGDNTAYMMESGELRVDGNCKGVVGPFMKGGSVIFTGSIRDVGAVRYGGTIRANRNLIDYYNFQNIYDLLRVIVEANVFQEVAAAIRQGGAIPLEREMKRVLHPQLVAIAGNHNLQLYERERSPIKSALADAEREYNELINQWNDILPKYEHAKKDAIGTGIINGATLFTPFAPLVLMFGMFTLFTGIDTFTLGGKLKELEPKITALESSMNQYRDKISSYDTKISEVRDYMRI